MIRLLAIAILAATLASASAQLTTKDVRATDWEPLFQGIDLARAESGPSEAPLKGVCARIDLRSKGIEFTATPPNGERPEETDGETALGFLHRTGAQLAINTHFFNPCCSPFPGQPKDVIGLAIADGKPVSPWNRSRATALVITDRNRASIVTKPPKKTSDIDVACAGMSLLRSGVAAYKPGGKEHPRTAAGVSRDGRYLFLLVIEGRLPNQKPGASLYETAVWIARFGAWNGVNLDGGGSSIMVASDPSTPNGVRLLNRPASGLPRVNGSHLGVFAETLK